MLMNDELLIESTLLAYWEARLKLEIDDEKYLIIKKLIGETKEALAAQDIRMPVAALS
jgi:hypothetical protein